MNNRKCIENKIVELEEVLSGIDRLSSVKDKLKKIDILKGLLVDIFEDQEDIFEVMSKYVNKEIDLQKLVIRGLSDRIALVCEEGELSVTNVEEGMENNLVEERPHEVKVDKDKEEVELEGEELVNELIRQQQEMQKQAEDS